MSPEQNLNYPWLIEDSYAGDTLNKIHQDLGCDYVVAGSYLAMGPAGKGRLRLDARVQDARTGETVASVAVVGSQSDLFDLASRAGEEMRDKTGYGNADRNRSASGEAQPCLPILRQPGCTPTDSPKCVSMTM